MDFGVISQTLSKRSRRVSTAVSWLPPAMSSSAESSVAAFSPDLVRSQRHEGRLKAYTEFTLTQVEDLEAVALSRLRIARQSGGNTVCAASPTSDGGGLAAGTILIVDPEVERLRPLVRELEAGGVSVFTVSDGIEAMQLMNQVVPDVVISEVTVPKLNGFELRERLSRASEFSRIPFVLVSHRKNDDLLRQAASLGIVHYFRKPVSVSELTGLVKNLTGRSGG